MLIHEILKLDHDAPILFTQLHVEGWGRSLIFDGIAGDVRFTLTFDECREMRWRVYAHLDATEPTPLQDFVAGRDQHRSPAQVLTGHFGLSLFYGTIKIEPAST